MRENNIRNAEPLLAVTVSGAACAGSRVAGRLCPCILNLLSTGGAAIIQ